MLLVVPTACVAKRDTPSSPSSSSSSVEQDIATLKKDVKDLQSKIASLPESSGGNYDSDIATLQSDIDNIYTVLEGFDEEFYNVLDEVDTMLADWEVEQETDTDNNNNTTDVDETTRWSLDVWTDYESFNLLKATLDYKKIEDEDDYDIWLSFKNTNIKSSYLGKFSTEPSVATIGDYYYDTGDGKMWQLAEVDSELWWVEADFTSIYQPVEIKEVVIEFSPRSSDRVIVDEKRTELYSSGYPSFGWGMDFSTRTDGTCKRIDAETSVRFTLLVPSKFHYNDPELPYLEQFKLEFELAYK